MQPDFRLRLTLSATPSLVKERTLAAARCRSATSGMVTMKIRRDSRINSRDTGSRLIGKSAQVTSYCALAASRMRCRLDKSMPGEESSSPRAGALPYSRASLERASSSDLLVEPYLTGGLWTPERLPEGFLALK